MFGVAFDDVRISVKKMNTDFCHTQQEIDAAAGYPVSIGDRTEGLDWERRPHSKGTRVWWHKRVYEAFASRNEVPKEQPESQPESVVPQPESAMKTAKIVKKYANTRIVGTHLGDNVFVGKHGPNLKLGQIIDYKNNVMVLKKLTSGKLHLIS